MKCIVFYFEYNAVLIAPVESIDALNKDELQIILLSKRILFIENSRSLQFNKSIKMVL